jgi:hypothetical protein
VKSHFILLPHLLFLSDELYVRLNGNSCKQNFAIYSSVLTKYKRNSTAAGRRGTKEAEHSVSQAQKHRSTEGAKNFSFIGFFICSLLSLKEFPLSFSSVDIRIPVSPCCPSKAPLGLTTFFYSNSHHSSHQAMNCLSSERLL